MLLIDESALRRMKGGGLGAASSAAASSTPATAIAQVFPGGIAPGFCRGGSGGVDAASEQGVIQIVQQSAASRFLFWQGSTSPSLPWAFTCSGSTPAQASAGKITGVVGTAAGTTAGGAVALGAAAGSVVPVVGTIIGAVVGLFGGLFAGLFKEYHAQRWAAVCGAVPLANQALQQIDQALAGGQMTPDQARAQYQSLQSQFSAAMKQGTGYQKCNLTWVYDMVMQTVIAARTLDLKNGVLTGGATAPWAIPAGGAVAGIASSLGVSESALPWLVLGGAAVLALAL